MKYKFIKIIFIIFFVLIFSTSSYAQSIFVDICPEISYKDIHFYYYEPFLTALIIFDGYFELFNLDDEYRNLRLENSEYLNEKQNVLIEYFVNDSKDFFDKERLGDKKYVINKIESFIFNEDIQIYSFPSIYDFSKNPEKNQGKEYLYYFFEKGFGDWCLKLYEIYKKITEKKEINKFFQDYHNALIKYILVQNIEEMTSNYLKFYNVKLNQNYSLPIFFIYKSYYRTGKRFDLENLKNNNDFILNTDFSGCFSSGNSIIMNINSLSKNKGYFYHTYFHELTHFFHFLNNYYEGPEIKTNFPGSDRNNNVYTWYKFINYLINNLNVCEFDADFCSFHFLRQNGFSFDFPLNYYNKSGNKYTKVMYYLSYLYSNYDLENNKNKYSLEYFSRGEKKIEFADSINEFLKNEVKPNLSMIIKKIKPIMDYYQSFDDLSYV